MDDMPWRDELAFATVNLIGALLGVGLPWLMPLIIR